jgi:uncharacterized protein YkwD
VEDFIPSVDDIEEIPLEPLYIDSATQRYILPQNKMEIKLRHELLNLRKNPRFYAQILVREYRPYYQGNALRMPGRPGMATREGINACNDAIRFLATTPPLTEDLEINFGMCLAAKEAVEECGPTGSLHYPSSVTKMEAYGYLEGEAVDLVGYGGQTMRDLLLMSYVLCDGDPSRERRNIIFNPKWKMMGVGAGDHNSQFKQMGVVNFSVGYVPLLEGMKLSPLFRKIVEVQMKDEARAMLEAFQQLQELSFEPDEEDDRRKALRAAAVKVSEAASKLVLTDKNETPLLKAVDVFRQLQEAENCTPSEDDERRAKLRAAAMAVGQATEQLVATNQYQTNMIRPVDVLRQLQEAEAAPPSPQDDSDHKARLRAAARGVGKATEQLVQLNKERNF